MSNAFQECFLRGEPMCRSTQLFNDAASVKMYLNLILNKMSETSSLCAIQEGTGKLLKDWVSTYLRKYRTRITEFPISMKILWETPALEITP